MASNGFNGGPVKPTLDAGLALSDSSMSIANQISPLFAENIIAKPYRTATSLTHFSGHRDPGSSEEHSSLQRGRPPSAYPEYVPQDGPETGRYILRDSKFWTCGFFPGTLYLVLERLTRFPQSVQLSDRRLLGLLQDNTTALAQLCSEPLHAMAHRTDTHDIGFMIMPAFQKHWELTGDRKSLRTILCGAESLATRFVPSANVIRSWDQRIQKNLAITSQDQDLIVIIDSMCNLHLMYYAASHFPEKSWLRDIATLHATTLLRTHLRPEPAVNNGHASGAAYNGQWYSTCHVANLDPRTGHIKKQFTAQGYSDESTWARGQAWGILGYAQTYKWTRDARFLDAACGLSEYFVHRLASAPACVEDSAGQDQDSPRPGVYENKRGRHVPLWDFDAPIEDESDPLRDSSAGAIAANGLLILHQVLTGLGRHALASHYLQSALDIAEDLAHFALASEEACFTMNDEDSLVVEDVLPGERFDGLLKHGTANYNENAVKRYANHGLVYGDYYLIELGNRLLHMGIV